MSCSDRPALVFFVMAIDTAVPTEPATSPTPSFVPLHFTRRDLQESLARARDFYAELQPRRTTRHFSSEPVARELIELAIRAAGTAPSGAHQQPCARR